MNTGYNIRYIHVYEKISVHCTYPLQCAGGMYNIDLREMNSKHLPYMRTNRKYPEQYRADLGGKHHTDVISSQYIRGTNRNKRGETNCK